MTIEQQLNIHEQLATRRQIAIVWSIDDVREIRPDLTDDQCWDVLQAAKHQHDAMMGLSWDTLTCIADDLFGLQPLTTIEITLDEFFLRFPIIKNHLSPSAVWQNGPEAGGMFETFGEEFHFVRQQNPRQVWTLTEDDEGRQFLQSGLHLVNRLAYAVSTRAAPLGIEIQVPIQSQLESAGGSHDR